MPASEGQGRLGALSVGCGESCGRVSMDWQLSQGSVRGVCELVAGWRPSWAAFPGVGLRLLVMWASVPPPPGQDHHLPQTPSVRGLLADRLELLVPSPDPWCCLLSPPTPRRTRSLHGPSPVTTFGPKACVLQNPQAIM